MTEPDPKQNPVVYVVDDDSSVRRALMRLLKSVGHRVESFASAEEFSQCDCTHPLGCIVLDVRMQRMDGMTLQRQLTSESCPLPIVFLSGHGDIPMSVEAMKHGAQDFLTKPVDEELLLAAVDRALNLNRVRVEEMKEETSIQTRVDLLSPRELEVMRCLLTGALNKQIAAHLGIVEKTVKVHRARAMEKLGIRSVAELVQLCSVVGVKPIRLDQRSPKSTV